MKPERKENLRKAMKEEARAWFWGVLIAVMIYVVLHALDGGY